MNAENEAHKELLAKLALAAQQAQLAQKATKEIREMWVNAVKEANAVHKEKADPKVLKEIVGNEENLAHKEKEEIQALMEQKEKEG